MVGGKRLADNVLESLDYIPGNVMRAALAKYILLSCPLYDHRKPDELGRYNYVYVRDETSCSRCKFNNACREFSNIRISFFYPEGYDIIPLTSKKCKTYMDHGFKDILTGVETSECEECMKINRQGSGTAFLGRMEFANGFRHGKEKCTPGRYSFTRTSLDEYTLTALDASLHSINVVEGGIIYEGEIKGFESLNLNPGKMLYVGKYTSIGFGHVKIMGVKDKPERKNLIELLGEFNKNIRTKLPRDAEKSYIPILFRSDAKLGIEELCTDTPLSDREYKQIWERLVLGDNPCGFQIEQVFSEQDIYKGYDTSKELEKWERKPCVFTKKGTSVLMSTKKRLEDIVETLISMETKGIGKDTYDGFGEIEICNELHVKGGI